MKKLSAVFAAAGLITLAAGAALIWRGADARLDSRTPVTESAAAEPASSSETPSALTQAVPQEAAEPSPASADGPDPTPEPYVSPIDFDSLQSVNPDIYAWLEMEGTEISYPVVQSPTNDSYYLNHNSDRAYAARGAIFSEHIYNAVGMTDPVTVLYGHHMQSGAMFGDLQKYYSSAAFFAEHHTLTIYTPETEFTGRIFAAVPWSGEHLLREYDFSDPDVFESFFAKVAKTRSLSANFREEDFPQADERVVILSTCLAGNNTQRYLVMAVLDTP